MKRHRREEEPIEHALNLEESRLARALEARDFKDPAFRLYSYQSRGLYLEQIKRYHALFPREKVFIGSSEQLFSRPKESLRAVSSFLGIDDQAVR